MKPIPPRSFSFMNDYNNCRRKAYRKYVTRDLPRVPETDAMRWGRTVHEALASRLARDQEMPPETRQYDKFAAAVARRVHKTGCAMYVEHKMGMRADGSFCDFYAKDCWLRGVVDVALIDDGTVWIGDWKTGKVREDPFELQVFALLVRALWQELTKDRITGNYIWLSEGKIGPPHDLNDTDRTLASVTRITREMEGLEEWAPTPNPLCGWCPVLDCEHNKVEKRRG